MASLNSKGSMSKFIDSLFSDASTYVPEMIGLAVILFLGYSLLVKKGVASFVKEGLLPV